LPQESGKTFTGERFDAMVEDLLRRCAYLADKLFRRQRDLRTMIWLAASADGKVSTFETSCIAPEEIDDDAALAALCAEMAADFAHDGVVGYAVAYSGQVTFVGAGCAPLAQPGSVRRRAIVIEAHDSVTNSRIAVCEIIAGTRPRLGAPQQGARASGRFHGLLAREEAAA
jgi:hypothetical protein